jgi:hypothetical protein
LTCCILVRILLILVIRVVVLNVISIHFYKTPTSVNLRNNSSAFKHSSFVEQEIIKLLKSGAAIECTDILPYAINPLTVI